MKINNITIKNFKSFKSQTIDFDCLNVLVGANASGKSNTIALFRFILNIINYGLEDAISLLGGLDYVINASIGKEKPISISFELLLDDDNCIRFIDRKLGQALLFSKVNCSFEILAHKRGLGYKIVNDNLKVTYLCVDFDMSKNKMDDSRMTYTSRDYIIEYKRTGNKFKHNIIDNTTYENIKLKTGFDAEFTLRSLNETNRTNKELILNKINYIMPPMIDMNNFIRIYDFDPKLLKKSSSLTSMRNLEEDGSNLANILQIILRNKYGKRTLLNLLSDSLPFINQISIENNFDKSISYKIKETYNNKTFYANFLSDGTVSLLALIVALYFDDSSSIIIIEEPERNLHPRLMQKIIEMAKETSLNKQVIITTHNSELVKFSALESLLLADRPENGFTSITKPKDNENVKIFLQTNLGIEDLFTMEMLGD